MKIVLTQNEIQAGNRLIKRIGIASNELTRVLAGMSDGQTLTQEEILKLFEFNSDKFVEELNKNKNVMSVVKHLDGKGTTCYTFIISEDFIVDTNEMYGDCIVEAVSQFKTMVKGLSIFFKGRVKEYLDKWKLE